MKVATMARAVSLLINVPATLVYLCLNIGTAEAADGAISGEGWDKISAVSCIKAQNDAESYAQSRCRYNGGIAVRFPSGCNTVDKSESWRGQPMFYSTYSLGAVTCNGTQEKDRQEAKAIAEKAFAAKKEKDDAAKASKIRTEKESRAKQEEIPPEKSSSIDDAFAKMEKQTGKVPAPGVGNINSEFGKLDAYRVEQERLRIAALKAKQERDARELEQRGRQAEATQFCSNAMKSTALCTMEACGVKPSEIISQCTIIRFFPREEMCTAERMNPKFPEWETCQRSVASKCARNANAPASLEACMRQRESMAQAR